MGTLSPELSRIRAGVAGSKKRALVNHVSEWNAAEIETEFATAEEIVNDYIPDMTELPKE